MTEANMADKEVWTVDPVKVIDDKHFEVNWAHVNLNTDLYDLSNCVYEVDKPQLITNFKRAVERYNRDGVVTVSKYPFPEESDRPIDQMIDNASQASEGWIALTGGQGTTGGSIHALENELQQHHDDLAKRKDFSGGANGDINYQDRLKNIEADLESGNTDDLAHQISLARQNIDADNRFDELGNLKPKAVAIVPLSARQIIKS
jgi:hypothetical protein